MQFQEIFDIQQRGLRAMSGVGVIGLHLVSGPLVGFGIGYALDLWMGTSPWCKMIFLIIGIAAGFLNVYRDSKELLQKMENEKSAKNKLETRA